MMSKPMRWLVTLTAIATVAAAIIAGLGTVAARRYDARTGEGLGQFWVTVAWAGVAVLLLTTLGLAWWGRRRAQRNQALRVPD